LAQEPPVLCLARCVRDPELRHGGRRMIVALLSLFVTVCVATHFGMPGKHSPEKRRQRRDRALARGFIRLPASESFRHVRVSASVAGRTKAVARSLEHHRAHNVLTGGAHATARAATRAAKPLLTNQEYKLSMQDHDQGNVARHSWPALPGCGGHAAPVTARPPSSSRWADVLHDDGDCGVANTATNPGQRLLAAPMKGQLSGHRVDPRPMRKMPTLKTELNVAMVSVTPEPECASALRAEAPSWPRLGVSEMVCGWQALVEAQNATIAVLAARLEQTVVAKPHVRDLIREASCAHFDIHDDFAGKSNDIERIDAPVKVTDEIHIGANHISWTAPSSGIPLALRRPPPPSCGAGTSSSRRTRNSTRTSCRSSADPLPSDALRAPPTPLTATPSTGVPVTLRPLAPPPCGGGASAARNAPKGTRTTASPGSRSSVAGMACCSTHSRFVDGCRECDAAASANAAAVIWM